ncbi:MAG: hypothetical protein WBV55_02645 [Candidatus Sulfotelmatobacter sp.]
MPGFAVGIVEAGTAAVFGAEEEAAEAEDVREGEDEPRVFGDNVGGDEIDFGEFVGDGASVDAAVGVEVVEAVLHLRGGFDLDADKAWAALGGKGLADTPSAIASLTLLIGAVVMVLSGTIMILTIMILTIEDDVVAVAVAEGFGDAEAVAGGGEGEGKFGDFAAAFGGEFAVEWSFWAWKRCTGSLGETRFASTESGLAFGHEFLVEG